MKPLLLAAISAVVLAGCAYRPIVDPAKSDMTRYDQDLAECREIAKQEGGPVAGAVVGGVAGHVVGRAAGGEGRVGAAVGSAGGAGAGARSRRGIIRNCMTGRGYAVLN